MTYSIDEYIPGTIYIVEYAIRFGGMDLFSRMTIVRLNDGKLWLHSPCKLDTRLKSEIDQLGEVAYIIAPATFTTSMLPISKPITPTLKLFSARVWKRNALISVLTGSWETDPIPVGR